MLSLTHGNKTEEQGWIPTSSSWHAHAYTKHTTHITHTPHATQKLKGRNAGVTHLVTLCPLTAFRSYFEIFNGPGEVDARSLKNILLLIGFTLTPAQVEEALMSADVNGEQGVFPEFQLGTAPTCGLLAGRILPGINPQGQRPVALTLNPLGLPFSSTPGLIKALASWAWFRKLMIPKSLYNVISGDPEVTRTPLLTNGVSDLSWLCTSSVLHDPCMSFTSLMALVKSLQLARPQLLCAIGSNILIKFSQIKWVSQAEGGSQACGSGGSSC